MMPLGRCKLCLQENQDLQSSHLLPTALYKMLLGPGDENPNPVIVTAYLSVQSSYQVTAPLMCRRCEQLLSANGENWVMKHVCRGNNFLLLDTLRQVPCDASKDGIEVYSCANRVDIDINSLSHFAVGILWKAAIHDWKLVGGALQTRIHLGPYSEALRGYLVGQAPFPNELVVNVTACTDFYSQQVFYDPAVVKTTPYHWYAFLSRGVRFDMFLGKSIPHGIRNTCSITSPARYIIVRSDEESTMKIFAGLQANTKLAKNLL
jgi:hypothetical protein